MQPRGFAPGAHAELRNRSSLNLGKLLFWPVHRKFGIANVVEQIGIVRRAAAERLEHAVAALEEKERLTRRGDVVETLFGERIADWQVTIKLGFRHEG